MMDSCRDSNVEPGLAARYSMLSDFRTSTMKSDPGCSMTGVAAGRTAPASRVTCAPEGAWAPRGADPASCALAGSGLAANAAAPAAAPFRKPRRPTEFFVDFAIPHPPHVAVGR